LNDFLQSLDEHTNESLMEWQLDQLVFESEVTTTQQSTSQNSLVSQERILQNERQDCTVISHYNYKYIKHASLL
jgi:hypothetical protein